VIGGGVAVQVERMIHEAVDPRGAIVGSECLFVISVAATVETADGALLTD